MKYKISDMVRTFIRQMHYIEIKSIKERCDASWLTEIKALDHIIIAGAKHFSFFDEGLMVLA